MKIRINVTKESFRRAVNCGADLSLGEPNEACAIAHAVRELFPTAKVWVYCIYFPELGIEIPFGEEVRRHIERFDSLCHLPKFRLELPEFSFEIEVPQSVIDSISIGQVYKILSESRSLELISI